MRKGANGRSNRAQSPQSRKALETRRTEYGARLPNRAQSPQSRKALETHWVPFVYRGCGLGRRALKAERHWRPRYFSGRCLASKGRRALKAERHWRQAADAEARTFSFTGAEPSKPKGTGDVGVMVSLPPLWMRRAQRFACIFGFSQRSQKNRVDALPSLKGGESKDSLLGVIYP